MEPHLYAAGDASVCPTTPAVLRSGGGRAAGAGTGAGRAAAERGGGGLPCGFSDAPGWRIDMEDAVCRWGWMDWVCLLKAVKQTIVFRCCVLCVYECCV